MLAAVLGKRRVELVKCRTDRPRGARPTPTSFSRRLRRARRTPPRRSVRRSHQPVYSLPADFPVFHPHLHPRRRVEEPGVFDDGRRHSPDGGLLHRSGERAHLPAAHQEDGAGNRRHALSGGWHFPQHRDHFHRQALPRSRAQDHERGVGPRTADVFEVHRRRRQGRRTCRTRPESRGSSGTHVDPSRDISIVQGPVDDLDEAAVAPAFGGKMGIDAHHARKWPAEGYTGSWPRRLVTSPAAAAKADAVWRALSGKKIWTSWTSTSLSPIELQEFEARATAGTAFSRADVERVMATTDLVTVGILGEAARKAVRGQRGDVRAGVAVVGPEATMPLKRGDAGEVRLEGVPASADEARQRVRDAVAFASSSATLTGVLFGRSARRSSAARSSRAGRSLTGVARGWASSQAAVPLDQLGDTDNAVEVVRAAVRGGLGAWRAVDRTIARPPTGSTLIRRAAEACSAQTGALRALALARASRPSRCAVHRGMTMSG